MARDVLRKIAKGTKLDELDVGYARDRGIPLPGDDIEPVDAVRPVPPVVQTGPAFTGGEGGGNEPVSGNPLSQPTASDSSDLESMSKSELVALGEQRGLSLKKGMTKTKMIKALSEEGS